MTDRDYKQTATPAKQAKESAVPFAHERQKFATQMDADLLRRLREYAKSEGRQIQSVLEEAVEMMLKEKQGYVMRPEVKAAQDRILKKYAKTFEALAK
ncbi:hypothetical protein [Hellea balneolensis]|uniref:hypothetical protein n=1 Tax=Hellea balneolensis TaxID=287478 RepID=UPI00041F6C8E|nr:hypothetical protein [Hellea balneolensis]